MSAAKDQLVPIEQVILEVRAQRVILAADLARIYGVETRALTQAVKRNLDKFPPDFMFQLSWEEAKDLPRLRSQIVILKRGQHLKYLPSAFTEHGAIMAATLLNSPQAVQMSVFVVRAFAAAARDEPRNGEQAGRAGTTCRGTRRGDSVAHRSDSKADGGAGAAEASNRLPGRESQAGVSGTTASSVSRQDAKRQGSGRPAQ